MRGVYTASAKITALAAAKTVMYVTAPSNKIVEVLSATLTDENNATNFQFRGSFTRVAAVGSPSGTAVTPQPHESGDAAAGSTVVANITNEPIYFGTDLWTESAPSLFGWKHEPVRDDEKLYITPGQTLGLRIITTPTSFDCDVRWTFKEIG